MTNEEWMEQAEQPAVAQNPETGEETGQEEPSPQQDAEREPGEGEALPGEEELRRMAEVAARMTLMRQQQWEQAAGEDLMLARALRRAHGGQDTQEILARLNAERDRQAAERLNMSPEELTAIRDGLTRRRDQNKARSEFARELMRQEAQVRSLRPDFDLAAAIEGSPAFRALILAGEPVARALAYLDPEGARREAEREVAERIRRRSRRAQPMNAAGRPARPLSIDTMTEAELRRIDDKLKRGEHVRI